MAQTFRIPFVVAAAAALLAPAAVRPADPAPRGEASGPIALAAPKDFDAAVRAVEKATGAKGERFGTGSVPLEEGRSFAVEAQVARRLLEGSHGQFRKAGLYLFRYERGFGLGGEKDRLGLLKTADRSTVLRRVGTAGAAGEKVAAWLDALAKDEPFELWEVGVDYVYGRFDRAPKDSMAVAKRCAEVAPELVAGRASTLELLAREIRMNQTLYLIW
jgi:hypothetical protein